MKYFFFLLVMLVPAFASAQKTKSHFKIGTVSAMECTELTEEPKPLNKITIPYPAKAKKAGMQGKVTYSALIDTNGNVIKTVINKSDNVIFDQAVIDAVMKLRFTPGRDDKSKVKVWWTETINFRIDSSADVPTHH